MRKRKKTLQKNNRLRKPVPDMGYQPYVDMHYYMDTYGGGAIPPEELTSRLRTASRHIDSLTYNRIVARGFSNLTEFQQDIICEVVCKQAEFEYENADLIDTVLSGYSLNGASVQFGQSWNVYMDKGVAMRKDVYALLSQAGLCCRLAR